ncbi:MAG: glucose/mannose-6-phosphate isomerase [Patescibacteria group bacterium]|nr:glucose/mannose-6-phosphate isomerase [Patescibacteria group bacterium]
MRDSNDALGQILKVPKTLVLELVTHLGEEDINQAEELAADVRKLASAWSPEVPSAKNLAKRLAKECIGGSLVVYAGPELGHAAYIWRRSFNRIAKVPAWQINYPHDAEDDMLAWSGERGVRPYTIVHLRSGHESKEVQSLFERTNRLLSGKRPHVHRVDVPSDTRVEQLIWASVLGQCVAAYMAVASGLDPSDRGIIEKFMRAK